MSIEISDFGDFLKVQLFKDDKVCLVTFNKPKRKNSLTLDDYMAIEKFFQFAKNSDDILVVVKFKLLPFKFKFISLVRF